MAKLNSKKLKKTSQSVKKSLVGLDPDYSIKEDFLHFEQITNHLFVKNSKKLFLVRFCRLKYLFVSFLNFVVFFYIRRCRRLTLWGSNYKTRRSVKHCCAVVNCCSCCCCCCITTLSCWCSISFFLL